MGRFSVGRLAAVGGVVVVALSACASPGGVGDGGGLSDPDHDYEAVAQWAAEVADAWSPSDPSWQEGYVPLQEPTTVEGEMLPAQKQALAAGWWLSAVPLPTERPNPGTVLFRSGQLTEALLSPAEAYQKMDLGDPPPCASPSVSPGAPDGDCVGLTVRGVSLESMELRTSRGVATVPAWRFDIGDGRAVLRDAVAEPASTPAPAPTPTNREAPPEMVTAQDVTSVEGVELHFRLGVGACDQDIAPIVAERPNVVVVSGGVRHGTGNCTDQLLLSPVIVSLSEPLGDRPVVDARNGTLVPLTTS